MSYWKKTVFGIILIGFVLTGALFWGGLAQYNHMLNRISSPPEENVDLTLPETSSSNKKTVSLRQEFIEKLPVPREDALKQEPFILLLYGLDKRNQKRDRGRPDTLMLALIHPALKRIQLISIPRDAYVPIPGHGYNKLNHSFSKGGVDLTIKTLEEWLEIKLEGYVAIDFAGFVKLIDLLGGIELDVDRDMMYHDPKDGTSINLKQGEQVLSGEQALQFVRFRYSNAGPADSDYKRMERQQAVLKKVAQKTTTIPSLIKILAIKSVMEEHIHTTLTPDKINSLLRWLVKAETEVRSTSMVGTGKYQYRLWYEIISDAEMKRIQTLIKEFIEVE